MNNKFKSFLLALVIFPCILSFVGCGEGQLDQNVNLDTTGNYSTDATAEELGTNLNSLDISESGFAGGYKLTVSLALAKVDPANASGVTGNFNANLIIKGSATSLNAALKVTGGFTAVDNTTENIDMKAYLIANEQDQNAYVNGSYGDNTMKAKFGSQYFTELMDQIMDNLPSGIGEGGADFSTVLTGASSIKKAISGTTVKYQVVAPITETTNATMYFVFENGVFAGCSVSNLVITEGTQTYTISVALVTFSGEIDFPTDLDTYQEFNPTAFS